MYIKFPCKKVPTFPTEGDVDMFFKHWGTEGYWDVTVYDTDGNLDGFDLNPGTYHGWCVDKYNTMSAGSHSVPLIDPYVWDDSIEWDKILWIVNHRDGYGAQAVQDAIWHYTDGLTVSGDAAALVAEAEAEGDGFHPAKGQLYVIVTDTPQVNIFEYDP
jgi:hypothetical protein